MKKSIALFMSFIFFIGVFQAPLSVQGEENDVKNEIHEKNQELTLEENETLKSEEGIELEKRLEDKPASILLDDASDVAYIYSVADLKAIQGKLEERDEDGKPLEHNYKLMTDLDLSGEVWSAIGTTENPFVGHFNGNGYSISNLTLNPNDQYAGLFGVMDNAVIENIHIKNVNITKTTSYVGGIVGLATNSFIRDSSVEGGQIESTSGASYIGGIVGRASDTTLERNMTNLIIKGNNFTGAMVGSGYVSVIIRDSYSLSTVFGNQGAFGYMGSGGKIENSYFAGKISSGTIGLGGGNNKGNYYNVDIQRKSSHADDIENARTTEEMIKQETFLGWNFEDVWHIDEGHLMPYLNNQPSDDRVVEISSVTDLEMIRDNPIGNYKLMRDLDLSNEVWSAIGTTENPFVGHFNGNGRSISNLTLNPKDQYSGLFGVIDNSVIENIHIRNVNITKATTYAGGIVGLATNSHIRDSSVEEGQIESTTGASYIGGIAGRASDTTLERNMTNLSIKGNSFTGAIVGSGYASVIIRDSYSLSTVVGNQGAFGYMGSGGKIENSYFAGKISSGAVGLGGGVNKNNFYDTDIQGKSTNASDLKIGRTTEEMMKQETFRGWDFENVWSIDEGNDYPVLRFNNQPENPDPEEEIEIETIEDFLTINNDLEGNYILTGNITISNLDPDMESLIGDSENPFMGTFDGNNKKISMNSAVNIPVFAGLENAEVKDITVEFTPSKTKSKTSYYPNAPLEFGDEDEITITEQDQRYSEYNETTDYLRDVDDFPTSNQGGLSNFAINSKFNNVFIYGFSSKKYTSATGGMIGYAINSDFYNIISQPSLSHKNGRFIGVAVGAAFNSTFERCVAVGNLENAEYSGIIAYSKNVTIINSISYYENNYPLNILADPFLGVVGPGCQVINSYSGSRQRRWDGSYTYIHGNDFKNHINSYYVNTTHTNDGGRTNVEMRKQETFVGWDFENVWMARTGKFPDLRRGTDLPNPKPPTLLNLSLNTERNINVNSNSKNIYYKLNNKHYLTEFFPIIESEIDVEVTIYTGKPQSDSNMTLYNYDNRRMKKNELIYDGTDIYVQIKPKNVGQSGICTFGLYGEHKYTYSALSTGTDIYDYNINDLNIVQPPKYATAKESELKYETDQGIINATKNKYKDALGEYSPVNPTEYFADKIKQFDWVQKNIIVNNNKNNVTIDNAKKAFSDSEFVYWATHGNSADDSFWLMKQNYIDDKPALTLKGNPIISAEHYDSLTPSSFINNEIKNTKWFALAGCSMLNYNDNEKTNAIAHKWAQSLLRDNNLHGMLGYWGSSPGGTTQNKKVERFFYNSTGYYSILDSWKYANQPLIGKSSWAAIYNADNIADTMFTLTPDDKKNGKDRKVYRIAYQNETPALISASKFFQSPSEIPVFSIKDVEPVDQDKVRKYLLGTSTFSVESKNTSMELDFKSDNEFIFTDRTHSIASANNIVMNKDEAVEFSDKTLSDMGIMPKNYILDVSSVVKHEMVEGSEEPSTVIEYDVLYIPVANDIKVITDDEKHIAVHIASNGLAYINYNWMELEEAESNNSYTTVSTFFQH